MKLIKVAFAIDAGWIGGINYYRNLLGAISQIPDRKIEPVILIGKKTSPEVISGLSSFEVIRTSIMDRYSFLWYVAKLIDKLTGPNFLLNILVIKKGVRVFSHTMPSINRRLKTIGWIPDFQHKHLPHLFSDQELKMRNKQFMRIAKFCDSVILSSQDAFKDFKDFAPSHIDKARVVRFVSLPNLKNIPKLHELEIKYGLDRPYFYLPNQFWMHKNHQVVIDALILLKKNHPNLLVLTTGATADYRHPQYFNELMQLVNVGEVTNSFKVLGVVPYPDVVALMIHSQALINPSFFEGWSTTVEEAKSLGVSMILSNIPVHLEQANDVATFFSPDDANDLADKLKYIASVNQNRSSFGFNEKINLNKDRLIEFAITYQKIVLELNLDF